jgi:hypothetical protein
LDHTLINYLVRLPGQITRCSPPSAIVRFHAVEALRFAALDL